MDYKDIFKTSSVDHLVKFLKIIGCDIPEVKLSEDRMVRYNFRKVIASHGSYIVLVSSFDEFNVIVPDSYIPDVGSYVYLDYRRVIPVEKGLTEDDWETIDGNKDAFVNMGSVVTAKDVERVREKNRRAAKVQEETYRRVQEKQHRHIRMLGEYSKASKIKLVYKYGDNDGRIDGSRLVFSDPKRMVAVRFDPMLIGSFIDPDAEQRYSLSSIFDKARSYYRKNWKNYNAVRMSIHKFIRGSDSEGKGVSVRFDIIEGRLYVNRILVNILRVGSLLEFIFNKFVAFLEMESIFTQTDFDDPLREFIRELNTLSVRQLQILKDEHSFFIHSSVVSNRSDEIPFKVGIDKEGWYIEFLRRHHLRYSDSKTKRDIKHVLGIEKQSHYSTSWRWNEIVIIQKLNEIVPGIEEDIIEYLRNRLLLSKLE